LKQYFEDILYRDVVSRNEIRDVVTMKNLVVYLLTNTGRLTSISNLKRVFGVSQDKIENYTAAIMETYLVHRLPKFSFSMKKSLRDRFKVYAIDTGLRNRVSFSFSEDSGWLAENVVMNHLKAGGNEVYYAGNGAETDFVVQEKQRVTKRIQVWYADPAETVIPERELLGFTAPAIEKTGGSATPAEETSPDGVGEESEVNPMHPKSVGEAVETCRNLLITNDLEGIRRLGNAEITCIPLPLYLME
jgi:predicted AAA+ superfamily ATPase